MSYAIIKLGGKQYRVREGERLLVDRLAVEDGKTFTPSVLLVGGDGEPQLDPVGVVVTAKVLGQQRGPKIRIGKYKKRTGYRKHNGFRSALTQIEIESIGGTKARASTAKAAKPEAAKPETVKPETVKAEIPKPETPKAEPKQRAEQAAADVAGLPAGYADLTVAAIKDAAGTWDVATLTAALEHERAHGNRKGAIAALESALTAEEGRATDGTQEGSRLLEERSRLPVEATGCQDLRRPGREGGDDHRPPARHAVPPRAGRRSRARRHDLRAPRGRRRVPAQRREALHLRVLG